MRWAAAIAVVVVTVVVLHFINVHRATCRPKAGSIEDMFAPELSDRCATR